MKLTISLAALLTFAIVQCYAQAASALARARSPQNQPQTNGRSVIGAL